VLIVFSGLRYSHWQRWSLWLLAMAVVALLLVFAFPPVNGSRRWLRLAGLSVQPSEVAKFALVLSMAAFIAKRSDCLHDAARCLAPCLGLLGLVTGLVFVEPDFGASAVIVFIVFSMWFVAGFRKTHLAVLALAGGAALTAMMIAAPYRLERLRAFLDPEEYLHKGGWQPFQSLVALGSGGWNGVGLGQSVQKYQFLSEAHTDFIFAIIGEETGLVGATVLMLVYMALILTGLRVASRTPDYFGMLTAYGLTAMIAIPTLVNIGVVTSSLPTKGLALPFLSYGGSSMAINCAAVGILMNIAAANYAQNRST